MLVGIKVGAATERPLTPSNIRHTFVLVEAASEAEAALIAAQMVASREVAGKLPFRDNRPDWEPSQPSVVMPTSTEVVELFSV